MNCEYKDLALLETVKLGDTIDVVFPKLGVNATAKVVKTKYDVLAGHYESIELGSVKSDLSTTISTSKRETNDRTTRSDLEDAVAEATRLITGQTGGYVVLNPPEHPQEILILNKPYIQHENPDLVADKVWRWNNNGLAFSPNGYFGTYTTAITSDGKIVADFIKTGSMSATRIFGGQLVLGGDTIDEDGYAGSLIVKNAAGEIIGEFNKDGLFLYGANGFYLLANPDPDIGFAGFQMMSGHTTPTPKPPTQGGASDEKLFWITKDEFHMRRAVVEQDILFCGKIRVIPIEIYDAQDPTIIANDGIAFVASSSS